MEVDEVGSGGGIRAVSGPRNVIFVPMTNWQCYLPNDEFTRCDEFGPGPSRAPCELRPAVAFVLGAPSVSAAVWTWVVVSRLTFFRGKLVRGFPPSRE